jgi:hypothetical protein
MHTLQEIIETFETCNSPIIMKDTYEVVWGEPVWTEFVEDPDTGEVIQVVKEPENWEEI